MSGDELRERLAEALWRRTAGPDAPPLAKASAASQRVLHADADALLPLVREYADQRAAEELRKAAETMVDPIDRYKLRGRATLIEHGEDPDREVGVAALDAAREQRP